MWCVVWGGCECCLCVVGEVCVMGGVVRENLSCVFNRIVNLNLGGKLMMIDDV